MTRWTPSTSFATNFTATGTTPSDRKPPFAAIVPEQALSGAEHWVKSVVLTVGRSLPVYYCHRTSSAPSDTSHLGHERTNSNLAAVGANAQARNAAFHSWRPVLADQCQSQHGCLPRIRPRIGPRLHD